MTLSDYFLSTLGVYGLPVLFAALFVSAVGVPLPSSLLLLAAGSFVAEGDMTMWHVLVVSVAGAVLGDNLGYVLGRWGGSRVERRLARLIGGEQRRRTAENWLKQREGAAVFFSRWLFTPLGPVINITSGMTRYSWPRFLFYDLLGEALWVTIYVTLGLYFSDRVQAISDVLGDFTWMIIGLLFVVVLGWNLMHYLRSPAMKGAGAKASGPLADETS